MNNLKSFVWGSERSSWGSGGYRCRGSGSIGTTVRRVEILNDKQRGWTMFRTTAMNSVSGNSINVDTMEAQVIRTKWARGLDTRDQSQHGKKPTCECFCEFDLWGCFCFCCFICCCCCCCCCLDVISAEMGRFQASSIGGSGCRRLKLEQQPIVSVLSSSTCYKRTSAWAQCRQTDALIVCSTVGLPVYLTFSPYVWLEPTIPSYRRRSSGRFLEYR